MKVLLNIIVTCLLIVLTIIDAFTYLIQLSKRYLHTLRKLIYRSVKSNFRFFSPKRLSHLFSAGIKKFFALSKKTMTAGKNTFLRIGRNSGLIAIKPFLIGKRFVVKRTKLKRAVKKTRHRKRVSVFPLPFFVKFKYFLAGGIFSLLVIFLPLLIVLFLQDLPNPTNIALADIPQTTKIFDRHGMLLYQIYANENRTVVPLDRIPKHLQQATIAIEDKDFYKHPGFDFAAIIRSVIGNASGKPLQGGSTITQQLIKSALLSSETSLNRKVKEVILAFWAERMYSKRQILQMYFNQIPYGGIAWGIEAASQTYFGKPVDKLNLAEAAFLAGIPRAPTIYSPYGTTPNAWKKRQQDVLYRMAELGYISIDQAKKAGAEQLSFQTPQTPIHAPHFVMYIRDLLARKYGLPVVERGGLSVMTTLDLPLQEQAQKIVAEEVQNNAYLNLTNGAAMITNPKTGDILSMVGSKNFQDPESGNVNLTTSLRQPGSSIKIVTYAAALQKGFTAASILDDSPVTYSNAWETYSPVNYDGQFHGRVPLRIAFANSFNIPAVTVLNQIGVKTFIDLGKQMGITTWDEPDKYGLSVTLGSADTTMVNMTTVYGTIANAGVRVNPNPILKITDAKGNVLEEKSEKQLGEGQRVLDSGITFILSDILADNVARAWEFGTNSPLTIPGHTVSVKTGTSDNKRDNWTIGYTDKYLVAVWVGNNDNSPMSPNLASGITGAAPIWNKLMTQLLAHEPDRKPAIPSGVVAKPCLGRIEYFLKGTENSVICGPLPSPGTQFRQRR